MFKILQMTLGLLLSYKEIELQGLRTGITAVIFLLVELTMQFSCAKCF
jgi:hypothetical protein